MHRFWFLLLFVLPLAYVVYSEVCPKDYYGDKCQYKSSCSDSNPCQNNGTCHTPFPYSFKTYRCTCPQEFVGANCQYENPCVNGGSSECRKNGGMCYPFIDTLQNKAVEMCLCHPESNRQGDHCEKLKCSVNNKACWGDLTNFATKIQSLEMDYKQCRIYGINVIDNATRCYKAKLRELMRSKDCNCEPLESMALFSNYPPVMLNPQGNIASHCLAKAASSSTRHPSSLPKCPERTMTCFKCLHGRNPDSPYKCMGDPQEDKKWREVCAEDYSAGKLHYENCKFLKVEIAAHSAQVTYRVMLEKGCDIFTHLGSCGHTYMDLLSCKLTDSAPVLECFKQSLLTEPECERAVQELGSLGENSLAMYWRGPMPHRTVCNNMAIFKIIVRNRWSCPADKSWDHVVYRRRKIKAR